MNTLDYALPYDGLFGGVVAVTDDHFVSANGFSNIFWGWGGEDDDFANRIKDEGFNITRPGTDVGR